MSVAPVNKPHYTGLDPQQLDALISFKPSRPRPWFPAREHKEWQARERAPSVCVSRSRSLRERIHLLVSEPRESRAGSFITVAMLIVILVSCSVFVLESEPALNSLPEGCSHCGPLRGKDRENVTLVEERRALGPSCKGCEPEPSLALVVIEFVCIMLFTAEYAIRVLTAHAVPGEGESSESSTWKRVVWQGVRRTGAFVVDPMNVVDVVAIVPFYLQLIFPAMNTKLSIIRLIRILRVFHVPEMGDLAERMLTLLGLLRSVVVFFVVFLIFSVFTIVIFASLVFYAEQGEWDSATGEYYRADGYYLKPKIPSEFSSISVGFWWMCVTITTVGYGDFYPTTTFGRVLGCVVLYLGVLLISLPITILGIRLADFYMSEVAQQERQRRVRSMTRRATHLFIIGQPLRPVVRAWNKWKSLIEETPALRHYKHRVAVREAFRDVPVLWAMFYFGMRTIPDPAKVRHQQSPEVNTKALLAYWRDVRQREIVECVRECVERETTAMWKEIGQKWQSELDQVVDQCAQRRLPKDDPPSGIEIELAKLPTPSGRPLE